VTFLCLCVCRKVSTAILLESSNILLQILPCCSQYLYHSYVDFFYWLQIYIFLNCLSILPSSNNFHGTLYTAITHGRKGKYLNRLRLSCIISVHFWRWTFLPSELTETHSPIPGMILLIQILSQPWFPASPDHAIWGYKLLYDFSLFSAI
jgi:hypothetical protein